MRLTDERAYVTRTAGIFLVEPHVMLLPDEVVLSRQEIQELANTPREAENGNEVTEQFREASRTNFQGLIMLMQPVHDRWLTRRATFAGNESSIPIPDQTQAGNDQEASDSNASGSALNPREYTEESVDSTGEQDD